MDFQNIAEQLKSIDSKVWAALIAAITSVIATITTAIIQIYILKRNRKDTKIAHLRKQLEEFYVPFDQYLSRTTEFYKNLRNDLPKEFRTLVYLIDNDALFEDSLGNKVKVKLSEDKLKLLEKIISIQEKLNSLIIEKSSLITDETLVKNYNPDKSITDIKLFIDKEAPSSIPKEIGLLTLFSVHIEYMRMARNGELNKEDLPTIEKYVYPRELNNKIKANINNLRRKIQELE